ncbi:MAG: polyprenyl synthetase family protein [Betaproteobacteria bacterium]|nr:polyprenyl synthetase family protein [Betaproteobacteria bacterium]
MAYALLQSRFAPALAEVDKVIREALHSDVVLVRNVAEYIVNSGGKRLRPALLVLSADACGYQGRDHYLLAAVVELIHTATLLHDDVVDESSLRRGRPTANAEFGNAPSVLVGDFLYSRSFQMMVGLNRMRVLELLSDATNVIAEGEVLQLLNCRNPDVDEARYLDVVRRKTAKLFEAAMRLGAILAGADRALEEALGSYGTHLGTAFQLIDDVLDYSGDASVIGKNLGDDLAEGKATLPLIHAMTRGTPAQREIVRHAITEGGLQDFAEIHATIESTGALAYARQVAAEESERATAALQLLPDSIHKDSLLQLATFAVRRSA